MANIAHEVELVQIQFFDSFLFLFTTHDLSTQKNNF